MHRQHAVTVPDLDPIAVLYHRAGWHPLPLPPGAKGPPPEGHTGYEGTDFTEAELADLDWTNCNLGLRMPPGVIGLDIDVYRGGVETFRTLANRLGKLPTTKVSHNNRNDGSGIRFFQVPVGMTWITTLPGMDIIQRNHRYAAVWPSTHPEGRAYAWYDQDEAANTDDIPDTDDLPELPWTWINELSRANQGDAHARSRAATPTEVTNFLNAHLTADAPGYTLVICQHFTERHAAGHSRHDTMQHCLTWAMEHVRAHVMAAQPALQALADLWTDAMVGEPRRAELTSQRRTTEFAAMLRHAVGKANAKTEDELHKLHDDVAGIPMQEDPLIDVDQPEDASSGDPPQDEPSIYINWQEFAKRDTAAHEWLVEGFWPLGRAMALWANAKEGKSEFVLWCAAKLAMGEHPFTGKPQPPVDVAYYDFEMTEDDLGERLSDFGFDLDRLDRLHYALYPPIYPLDTEKGGKQILEYAQAVQAQAVLIDTLARVVAGDENLAQTVDDFYRHTGIRFKASRIGYLRLDHAGHNQSVTHPRGSSAKLADLDVIWRQKRTQTGIRLDCAGASRLSWVGPSLVIDRHVDVATGIISYSQPITFASWPTGTVEKAAELDQIGVPLDAGRPAAIAALKAAGLQPGRWQVISAALKYRRQKAGTGAGHSSGHTSAGTAGAQPDDGPDNLFSDQGE